MSTTDGLSPAGEQDAAAEQLRRRRKDSSASPASSPDAKRARASTPAAAYAPDGLGWYLLSLPVLDEIDRVYNERCLTMKDIVKGDIRWAVIGNYAFNVDWMLEECPKLRDIPDVVVLYHDVLDFGRDGEPATFQKDLAATAHWHLFKPPPGVGVGSADLHHSKYFLLFYDTGVRVVVHTANTVLREWRYKSQGFWVQDFPLKADSPPGTARPSSDFEDSFVRYMQISWPQGATLRSGERVSAESLRLYDFSAAGAHLVPSVPGNHRGDEMRKWGHMRVRALLEQETFSAAFAEPKIVIQTTSLGSMYGNAKQESAQRRKAEDLIDSLSAGRICGAAGAAGAGPSSAAASAFGRKKEAILVWPTKNEVEGAMMSKIIKGDIPATEKKVNQVRGIPTTLRLHSWSASRGAQVTAGEASQRHPHGREIVMPHMKTYLRFDPADPNRLAWFLLSSHNLSWAAWGELQDHGRNLRVTQYELGVLFTPRTAAAAAAAAAARPFACGPFGPSDEPPPGAGAAGAAGAAPPPGEISLVTTMAAGAAPAGGLVGSVLALPVPYPLPPTAYDFERDLPWSFDEERPGHVPSRMN